MALKNTKQDNQFIYVLADGSLRMAVDEFTEGAVRRDYELKDGTSGTKYELVFTEVSGLITDVKFHDGEYGKSLNLTISDGDDKPVILSLQTAQNFGEDMMKKLLAIDLSVPVRLAPYSLVDKATGKTRKGITVYQVVNGVETKIKNYFQEGEGKESKLLYGYPEVPAGHGKKAPTKDDWKMYFMQCRIFMTNYISEHFKLDSPKEEDWSQDASYDPVKGAATKDGKDF